MQNQDTWDNCSSGVVSEMATGLRLRRQWKRARRTVVAGIAFLLVAGIGVGVMNQDPTGSRPGLTCREAVPLFAKYNARVLDASVTIDVRDHLSHCPSCRKRYQEMHPNEVRNHRTAPGRTASNQIVALASNY